MQDIEEKYKRFEINEELYNHLCQLSDVHFPFASSPSPVILETIIMKNGKITIISKEKQYIKLV
jgi:hypothetical protein